MNGAPLIGITCYVERARWGAWDMPAALVPYSYVRMVTAAGGCAIVLPPDAANAPAVIQRLDGLVLAGGADIAPERYGAPVQPWAVSGRSGAEPNAHSGSAASHASRPGTGAVKRPELGGNERTVTRPDRDQGELALLRAALEAELPVLGVCRGAQLLAVAYGGTLHQHLPDVVGHEEHQPEPGVFGAHGARFTPGSRAAVVFGPAAEINSYHHQGIADPGRLAVTGLADDGVVEAVEDRDRPFVLGVQWHPEEVGDVRPFAALVESASQQAGERVGLDARSG